jgi:glyoxylase-like metal-dependent hydrolase (beta-lactamase superfamily II)
MFGVVPKVLWQNVSDVDDENRIQLCTRTLLVINRRIDRVIIVDTGCGPKWSPDKAERYAIKPDPHAIPSALKRLGLAADAVTDVIVTHLHFDHNGGLAEWVDGSDGATRLIFPNARHCIHRQHWEHARSPHVKDRGSFIEADFAALDEHDKLHLLDGETPEPLCDGVDWLVSHGHTPYQIHPIFSSGKGENRKSLLFVGDLVPTIAHLRLPWVMAYDVQPLVTIDEKGRIFERCLGEGLLLAFPHDPKVGGVAIEGTASRPIVSRTLFAEGE